MTAADTVVMVGSSQEIVDRILAQHELLGHDRFLAQLDIGAQPLAQVLRSIERLAVDVAPQVRRATNESSPEERDLPSDLRETASVDQRIPIGSV